MTGTTRAAPIRAALLGLLLGLAGIISYFIIALRFGAWLPEVRNSAHPNLLLVALGLALSAVGVRRTLAAPRGARCRWLGPSLAALNLTLAGAFAWILYGMSAVPLVSGPTIGAPAPDFALVDQEGQTNRLSDFGGTPLLLVFYRGHW